LVKHFKLLIIITNSKPVGQPTNRLKEILNRDTEHHSNSLLNKA
jgi:hypothetical protein